jgi:histidyl-tRNA synthetase
MGEELRKLLTLENYLRTLSVDNDFQEIRLPNIWHLKTFTDKAGGKLTNTMYNFKDKGDRDLCLVPEATAIIAELYDAGWKISMKKPVKLFYFQRCYRYDKPQAGRYREFLQFGVEVLGSPEAYEISREFAKTVLHKFVTSLSQYEFKESPERGLHYYTGRTYEVECHGLGAQKQLIGGGEYAQGAGFGLGMERLQMVINGEQNV